MFKWISSIQNAIKGVKTNRKEAKRKKSEKRVTKDGKQLSTNDDDELKLNSASEPIVLHCETKNRPRGPTGRRPPARKSLHLKQSNGSLKNSDNTMNGPFKKGLNESITLPTISEEINLTQSSTNHISETNNTPSAARVSIISTPERISQGSILSDQDHHLSQPRFSPNFCDDFNNLADCNELSLNMSFMSTTNSPSKMFENGLPIVSQSCNKEFEWSPYKDKLGNLVNYLHSVPGGDICKQSAQIKKDLKSMDVHLVNIHEQLSKLKQLLHPSDHLKDKECPSEKDKCPVTKGDLCVDEIRAHTNFIQEKTVQLASSLDVLDDNLTLIMESIKELTCNSSLNPLPELVV